MTLKNFRASDFKREGSDIPKVGSTRDRSRLDTPAPTTEPIIRGGMSPEDVPSGTVPEILSWIGEDPVRAQKALDQETANAKPRRGLVKAITEIIDAEASK